MKKIYSLLFIAVLIAGCSKDFLKKYDTRIKGTWQLTDVDRRGIGGSVGHLPFSDGQFIFDENGGLTYNDPAGTVYKGTWDIKRNYYGDDETHSLLITAVDYVSQDVKSEFFDEMTFTGTDHFKAFVNSATRSYVFHFRRQ